jgi:FkbM family methyltransferase
MYNYNFALSNQFGICEMSVNLYNLGGNFISNLNNQEQIVNPYNINHIMVPKTKIAMIPLDSLLSVFKNKIGCIKMDVEGFEKHVLEGAQQLIIRDKPIIVIEVWPEQKEWIDNFLYSLNYEITHIYKDEKDSDFNYMYQYKSSFETSIV